MAELTAGATALPPNTALILTDLVLGLPWYIWAFVAFGVVFMVVIAVLIYYWYVMRPVGGYFPAQKNGDPLLIFLRKSGKASLRPAKYLTGIYNDRRYPLSWIQRSNSSFGLGKCTTKIVTDMNGIASEPELNMAIKTWVSEWNDKELRLQANEYYSGRSYTPDLVKDYYDLYRMVKEGRVDDPVIIPSVYEVPLYEIERYLAHIGPGDLEGHIATRIEEDKIEEENADKNMPGWMWMFIAVEVIILILVCLICLI
jgi:hypothetical protein